MRPETGLLTVIMVSLGVFLHLMPGLRKRNLYFGVTVSEDFRESEEARAIARDFRILTWAGTILAVAACQFALSSHHVLLGNLAPELQIAVAVVAWVRAWRRARQHAAPPAGLRGVNLLEGSRMRSGQLLALVLPLLGPVGAAGWLWSKYSALPARYPAHWNAAGHADRYVAKSPMAVLAAPLFSAVALLLLLVLALGICFGSRRGTSGERPGWASRFRRLNLAMLTTVMWLVSGLTSAASVAPLLPPGTLGWLMPVLVGALLVATVAFLVPLVRMSLEPSGGSDATPDECWKGGAIYYNPADPAFMVERRDGIGYTINFGNRLSWVLMAVVILFPLLVVFISLSLK